MKITLSKLIKFMSMQCFIVVCIQTLTMQLLVAGATNGQNLKETKLSIEARDKKVVDIFKLIEKKTEYVFVYTDDVRNSKSKISFSAHNESLENILISLRRKTHLKFSVLKYTITATFDAITSDVQQKHAVVDTTRSLSGTVLDEQGVPLPGVSVIKKGTLIGTVTDADGKFNIGVRDGNVLVFTFVGYKPSEVAVGTPQ
jgi:TonB-dependent starch-binding outer membrane protein SusC